MTGHTPGPWRVDNYAEFAMVITPTGMEIGNATERESACLTLADAQLIAAAPELLQACKMALNDRMFKDWPEIATALIAAIAKAEGQSV